MAVPPVNVPADARRQNSSERTVLAQAATLLRFIQQDAADFLPWLGQNGCPLADGRCVLNFRPPAITGSAGTGQAFTRGVIVNVRHNRPGQVQAT